MIFFKNIESVYISDFDANNNLLRDFAYYPGFMDVTDRNLNKIPCTTDSV